MQVGAHNSLQPLSVLQKQRPATRPQPVQTLNDSQRLDATRKTNYSAVLQGEYVQRSSQGESFEHLEGIGLSVRSALETYTETASFQPRSASGELVGVDLYV